MTYYWCSFAQRFFAFPAWLSCILLLGRVWCRWSSASNTCPLQFVLPNSIYYTSLFVSACGLVVFLVTYFAFHWLAIAPERILTFSTSPRRCGRWRSSVLFNIAGFQKFHGRDIRLNHVRLQKHGSDMCSCFVLDTLWSDCDLVSYSSSSWNCFLDVHRVPRRPCCHVTVGGEYFDFRLVVVVVVVVFGFHMTNYMVQVP